MKSSLDQAEINSRNLHALLNVIYQHQKRTGTAFNYSNKMFDKIDLASDDRAYTTNTARQQGWIEDREVDGHRWLSITGVGLLILNSLNRRG